MEITGSKKAERTQRTLYTETISQNREAPNGFAFRPCVIVEKEVAEWVSDGLRSPLVRFEDEMKHVLDLAMDEEENGVEEDLMKSQNGIRMEENRIELDLGMKLEDKSMEKKEEMALNREETRSIEATQSVEGTQDLEATQNVEGTQDLEATQSVERTQSIKEMKNEESVQEKNSKEMEMERNENQMNFQKEELKESKKELDLNMVETVETSNQKEIESKEKVEIEPINEKLFQSVETKETVSEKSTQNDLMKSVVNQNEMNEVKSQTESEQTKAQPTITLSKPDQKESTSSSTDLSSSSSSSSTTSTTRCSISNSSTTALTSDLRKQALYSMLSNYSEEDLFTNENELPIKKESDQPTIPSFLKKEKPITPIAQSKASSTLSTPTKESKALIHILFSDSETETESESETESETESESELESESESESESFSHTSKEEEKPIIVQMAEQTSTPSNSKTPNNAVSSVIIRQTSTDRSILVSQLSQMDGFTSESSSEDEESQELHVLREGEAEVRNTAMSSLLSLMKMNKAITQTVQESEKQKQILSSSHPSHVISRRADALSQPQFMNPRQFLIDYVCRLNVMENYHFQNSRNITLSQTYSS